MAKNDVWYFEKAGCVVDSFIFGRSHLHILDQVPVTEFEIFLAVCVFRKDVKLLWDFCDVTSHS